MMLACVVLLVASVAQLTSGELFSSTAHLQTALHAEKSIAEEIRQYIEREQDRLQKLSKIADDFEQHSSVALQSPDSYIGNPVNAYLFVKHFTLDWDRDIDTVLKNNSKEELSTKIEQLREYLPTYEDLTGSVNALLRLQDTYKLDTADIALGNVGGVTSQQLSAWDCFELGRLAYNEEDFYHTIMWMEQALTKPDGQVDKEDIFDYLAFSLYKASAECFEVGRQAYVAQDFYHTIMWMQEAFEKSVSEQNKTVEPTMVLDYLTYSMFKQGNVRRALTLTNEMLEMDPDHKRALANKAYYQRMIEQEDANTQRRGDDGEVVTNTRQLDEYRSGHEFVAYEALCRNETIMPNKYANMLKCRYVTNNHPLLILKPLKEEQLYKDPYLVVFHEAISDAEITLIKQLATPKLGRATVHNPKTGKLETAHYRVSKSCWLSDYDSHKITYINNKIGAATGLSMETAEELQIANYGIGGQYEPHFDYARISDVQAGGATVFPYIGLKVFPEKGKAIFWYNLHKNGEGIYNTRHAACPVLVGSKWVSNKWIHERGQEFNRKCGLHERE